MNGFPRPEQEQLYEERKKVSGTCPECGSHDVVQISRVTGYLQEVSGWNAGKQQELKDRARYTVA